MPVHEQGGRRVLSLLPAATEIVAALGALEQLVAVTHECDFPPGVGRLPQVTSSAVDRDAPSGAIDAEVRALAAAGAPAFRLDEAALAALAPQVVLTQTLCEVCALPEDVVRSALARLPTEPVLVSLRGASIAGVWEDIRRIGGAIGRPAAAEQLLDRLQERVRRVHETLKAAGAPRPRVVVLEWLQPVYAAGHWCPELVRRAGGVDALVEPGAHSLPTSVEAVRAARPEILLFAPCGFDVARAEREARALLESPAWEWARGCGAWALDGNALTSRPGPRLADAIEVMAAIFAPHLFAAPSPDHARALRD